jgi:hypothetical protein
VQQPASPRATLVRPFFRLSRPGREFSNLYVEIWTPFLNLRQYFLMQRYALGVSITDNASVIFGGSEEPCALGNMYSIGAIGVESNGKIQVRDTRRGTVPKTLVLNFLLLFFVRRFQAAVTDLLEPFGLEESRMYINFFDMPRANVGWSRKTFAG